MNEGLEARDQVEVRLAVRVAGAQLVHLVRVRVRARVRARGSASSPPATRTDFMPNEWWPRMQVAWCTAKLSASFTPSKVSAVSMEISSMTMMSARASHAKWAEACSPSSLARWKRPSSLSLKALCTVQPLMSRAALPLEAVTITRSPCERHFCTSRSMSVDLPTPPWSDIGLGLG